MADLGEIQVRIAVATKQLKADLALAQAEFSKFGKKTEVEMNTMSAKVQATFARMGASLKAGAAAIGASISRSFHLAGMVIGAAFVYGSKKAIGFASDAQESLNLFRVVMDENADAAMKWSKTFSSVMETNETQNRKYLSTLQLIIEGQDIGAEKAYEMAKALTKLTYDLASFRNLEFDEAFDKITSGIVGMPRPLRDVGINLQDATIKQHALTTGLIASNREMTTAEKTLARFQVLMEKTKPDRDDFTRTSKDWANSWRILKDLFRTTGETYGEGLIKGLQSGNAELKKLLKENQQFFKDWGEGVGITVTAVVSGLISANNKLKAAMDWLEENRAKQLQSMREFDQYLKDHPQLSRETRVRFPGLGPDQGISQEAQQEYQNALKRGADNAIGDADRALSIRSQYPAESFIHPEAAREKEIADKAAQLADEIARINEEMAVNHQMAVDSITADWERARIEQGKFYPETSTNIDKLVDKLKGMRDKLNEFPEAISRLKAGFTDTFSSAILEAKTFSEMMKDLGNMIARIAVETAVGTAVGGVFRGLGLTGAIQHSGGTVGQGARQMNLPSMAAFGAPRFHNGLARDEKLTVLQDGEEVTPKGSSPKAIVNVNSPDVPINAEVTGIKQSMGNMIIDVLVSAKRRRDPRLAGFG